MDSNRIPENPIENIGPIKTLQKLLFFEICKNIQNRESRFLISGFRSLPSYEKKRWDKSKLSKFVGNRLLFLSIRDYKLIVFSQLPIILYLHMWQLPLE